MGMLSGLIFTSTYIIYFKFIYPELNLPDYWLWGISPEGIGFIGMLLNVIIGTLVSLITPKPPARVGLMIDNIRRP